MTRKQARYLISRVYRSVEIRLSFHPIPLKLERYACEVYRGKRKARKP